MSRWRKRLFVATSRITADAAGYFRLAPGTDPGHGDHGSTCSRLAWHDLMTPTSLHRIQSTRPGSASASRDVCPAQHLIMSGIVRADGLISVQLDAKSGRVDHVQRPAKVSLARAGVLGAELC